MCERLLKLNAAHSTDHHLRHAVDKELGLTRTRASKHGLGFPLNPHAGAPINLLPLAPASCALGQTPVCCELVAKWLPI